MKRSGYKLGDTPVLTRMTIAFALVAIAGINPALANTNATERDTPRALAEAAYVAMGLGIHSSNEAGQLRTLRSRIQALQRTDTWAVNRRPNDALPISRNSHK